MLGGNRSGPELDNKDLEHIIILLMNIIIPMPALNK